jgi:hypothetical protein
VDSVYILVDHAVLGSEDAVRGVVGIVSAMFIEHQAGGALYAVVVDGFRAPDQRDQKARGGNVYRNYRARVMAAVKAQAGVRGVLIINPRGQRVDF